MNTATKIRDIKKGAISEVKYVHGGDPLRKTIDFLAEHKIGVALVVDGEGGLSGVISERDVIRAIYEHGGDALDYSTASYMIKQVITCSMDDDLLSVAQSMSTHHFRHLPIVDDGFLAGMISASDLMDQIAIDN